MDQHIPEVIKAFGLNSKEYTATVFGSGLIHKTYLVQRSGIPAYILQQVNHNVFKKPEDISHNLLVIGNYISVDAPDYPFTFPVKSTEGNDYVIIDENYFRIFNFIEDTHTIDTCLQPEQAYEAAVQFGRFTSILNDFRTDMLRYTIPGFHDLSFRYQEFISATENGNAARLSESTDIAQGLFSWKNIADQFEHICNDPHFRKRATHHDTKISNVLLDKNNHGVCVIDLDTVMPGYFISDVGDMIRTYVSPANEEDTDLANIEVRKDFVQAIYIGYMEDMGSKLTAYEIAHFIYAGKFMIYMQALRFYTDYLYDDRYYGAAYSNHNLNRAMNQMKLLQELIKSEKELLSSF